MEIMKQPTKADTVYQALRQAIIEQDLKPGAKLPEDEIGTPFGISRTVVREALARLHTDGLVSTGGKRTATVATPSLEEAKDVFRVRRALEREAIRMVADKWTPEIAARFAGHLREEDAARAAGDMKLSVRLAERFHILLAELTENAILLGYMTQLVSRCSLILSVYGRPHSADCSVCEHGGIVEALAAGRPEEAVKLMDRHIVSVETRTLDRDAGEGPSLADILSRHAGDLDLEGNEAGPKRL